MKLFWVDSLDHSEDWFVVAKESSQARHFYAGEMGYDEIDDEITALDVCGVPGFPDSEGPFFADSDMIKLCGGELILYDNADLFDIVGKDILQQLDGDTRIVKINNRIYVEGSVARTALYYLANK